jgi:hypothetical protein
LPCRRRREPSKRASRSAGSRVPNATALVIRPSPFEAQSAGSTIAALALRPGFRLKARRPSIEPPGPGDDTSLGKQSSELQGQFSSAGRLILRVSHPKVSALALS